MPTTRPNEVDHPMAFSRDTDALQTAKQLFLKVQKEATMTSLDYLQMLEDDLMSSLATIRRVYNSKQPINRLPPEILGLVFKHTMRPLFSGQREIGSGFRMWWPSIVCTEDLIPLTHVCHRWREIALGSPLLWSSIDNENADLALDRAANAALKIFIEDKPCPAIINALTSGRFRVRELHWSLADVDAILSHEYHAPGLEMLTVCGQDDNTTWTDDTPPKVLLLDGHTPQIRWLSLSWLPWFPANHMPNLTGLYVSRAQMSNALSHVLAFLSRLPALVDLVLANFELREVEDNTLLLSMDNLRRLILRGMSIKSVVAFLSHVQLSETTAVTIECVGQEDALADGAFAREMSRLPAMTHSTRISVQGEFMFPSIVAAGPLSALRLDTHSKDQYMTLLQALPTAHIRELWYHQRHDKSGNSVIWRLLRCFPALETLVTAYIDVRRFLDVLASSRDDQRGPVCLKLTTLRVLDDGEGSYTTYWRGVLTSFLPRDERAAKLNIRHLHLTTLRPGPGWSAEREPALEKHFESVVYDSHEDIKLWMELPPICERGANLYWGAFKQSFFSHKAW